MVTNKRDSASGYGEPAKKVKLDDGKKDDIAIDSELLGDQSSYTGNPNQDQSTKDEDDADAAVAAAASLVSDAETANAAAAALSHQQSHPHHHHHHHQQQQQQQQQLHQRLAYENHYGQQLHSGSPVGPGQHHRSDNSILQPTTLPPSGGAKPQHGTDEWHRVRRENHKEVERRRRESINQGIKELAALIPTPDTNKAQILSRAVEFIRRLKENENNNIEKWTLEKLLTEQAVSELNASNEKLKTELERAYREIESLRRKLEEKS